MKKTTLQLLAYSTFTISLIFTVALLSVNATTKFNMCLMACLGLCMELSKCFMLHLSIKQKNRFYKGISVALFMFSFVASISAFTNNKLNVIEEAKLNSPVYVATKKIIEEKRNYINKLDPILYRTKINNINQEIFNLELSLESINVKTGKGTSEVFNLIGVFLGVNGELLSLFFSVGMALVFELITVVFFYEFLKDEVAQTNPQIEEVKQPIIEVKKEIVKTVERIDSNDVATKEVEETKPLFEPQAEPMVAVKKINKIGFDADLKKPQIEPQTKPVFTNKEITKYTKFMITDAKKRESNISSGYKKIAKEIGISQTKAMKIKSHLEIHNVVRCEGQKTKILKWEE